MFKFESFPAYVPELEVRGPQTPAATATETKTEDENIESSLEIREDTIEFKTTPGEGDEGFEGPPYRQSLMEDDASEAFKIEDAKPLDKEVEEDEDIESLSEDVEEDDANEASKIKDIKVLSKEVEEQDDVKTLSAKAEIRARQGTNAWVPDPVKSDSEKAGTVEPLEDGGLREIVAPVRREA